MHLLANLDCEARWAGVALPAAVVSRISLYATLLAACADDDASGHDVWLPAAVDPARLIAHPGWTSPRTHTGVPPRIDLAWADPAARLANDRSHTLALADALGVALPGARTVGSLAELDAHISAQPAAAWVCKARWTAAGRDRAHGHGPVGDGELRRRLARMFDRLGPLVFEPWLDRVADFGVCGTVAADGAVHLEPPHRLRSDPRGGFVGVALAPAVEPAIAEPLHATARAVAIRLAATAGYHGPFAIDAFTYRRAGAHPDEPPVLHPLCELNARRTFGWIARGLAHRLGAHQLGFDAPPPGAQVLIAPAADRVTAWCA
jgi:hypothetical protein